MPLVTNFAVEDTYKYLSGFGNYHQLVNPLLPREYSSLIHSPRSEAILGSIPLVNNHPINTPFGLRTEKVSGTSFVAPRYNNLHTYLYRAQSSYNHSPFTPWNHHLDTANPSPPKHLTPNSYMWPVFPFPEKGDWTSQRLLGNNGSPQQKTGVAIWLFNIDKDMKPQTAFSSQDGEALVVPQSGALNITTEFGKLLVRQNEIAVIPRGIRYRVTLPEGKPCRGYVCELYQGHFRLPELGIIGSTGLGNARDFQVPTAFFDGKLVDAQGQGNGQVAVANDCANNDTSKWTIISRLNTKLWSCTQDNTPFDVAGWQGTLYPYKYDLARFCYLGNLAYDHHDPSLFVLLTAPSFGKEPGTAVVDFAAVGSRWEASEDTLWVPWYHRNTMQEFIFPIVDQQDANSPFNGGSEFSPFGGWLNGSMVTHGSNEEEYKVWTAKDTRTPSKLQDDGITSGIFETECPLYLTDWAFESSQKNFKSQISAVFKE
jgi:homogentisate 1,2-dioxygenase